ncbi:helix-turn-helix domain-containing protein [Eubacteriales bacterium OttesenSCG-928-A19]|nr:helix-turn-helix domain-containing protein [Eubacteriales bacterium OttesenSCG-928-A19]
MSDLASMIYKARKAARVKQLALCGMVGKHKATVSDWETGRALPDLCDVPAIARALNIDERALMDAYNDALDAMDGGRRMCGDCRERWLPDAERGRDCLRYGRCIALGVRTERCDWCRVTA